MHFISFFYREMFTSSHTIVAKKILCGELRDGVGGGARNGCEAIKFSDA